MVVRSCRCRYQSEHWYKPAARHADTQHVETGIEQGHWVSYTTAHTPLDPWQTPAAVE